MKKNKILLYILLFIFFTGFNGTFYVSAQEVGTSQTGNELLPESGNEEKKTTDGQKQLEDYHLLAPLPGLETVDSSMDIKGYVNTILRIVIGIIGVLAVVMIIVGGVQYMSTDAIGKKEGGKETIQNAVWGVILALGSFLILNTINPQLTSLSFGVTKDAQWCNDNYDKLKDTEEFKNRCAYVQAEKIVVPADAIEGDQGTGNFTSLKSLPSGVLCPKPSSPDYTKIQPVAASFVGRNTYRFGGGHGEAPPFQSEKPSWICEGGKQCRTFCPQNSSCLDCSAFVNQVLECAGFAPYQSTTGAMTTDKRSEVIKTMTLTSVNDVTMRAGDLLFWNGHVVIYIGNGKTAESFGGTQGRIAGGSIAIQNADYYWKQGKLKYIYRAK